MWACSAGACTRCPGARPERAALPPPLPARLSTDSSMPSVELSSNSASCAGFKGATLRELVPLVALPHVGAKNVDASLNSF
jgi:hypothetical protein